MIHIILLYALLDLTYYTEEFLHILFERIQASANIKTYDIESNGSIERYIDEQKSFGGPGYHRSSDQIYYEWLSDGVLRSKMENHIIIIESIGYPPLLIDPFGQYDQ
ncbi:unnamed protein product [Adineta steineri]|uniref:Uncharacterized protein n=1 Tax=Adineta steineri TaxID=433720 RepID=A0A819XM37_9BILA|nr:unnamed protein product [Adineta steineri]